MRYPLLIAFGAALALATPTVAQTVKKQTEREQPRRQEIERHIETLENDDDDDAFEMTTEWNTDSLTEAIERHVDSLREAIEQRADSIAEAAEQYADSLRDIIERRADSLEAIADSLQSVNDARQTDEDARQTLEEADIDSLRTAVRNQMASTREVMGNAREINKQMRNQMREMRKIHVLTRRDTTGMAKELQAAELALESARRSIQPLDSSMIIFRRDGADGLRMEFGNSADPAHFMMMVEKNDSVGRIYFNGGNGFLSQTLRDSPNGLFYQQLGNGTWSTMSPPPETPMSIPANGRIVVIGTDSIHVVDGKDVQTIIQISHDSSDASDNRHTIVVISSRSDGRSSHATITMTKTTMYNGIYSPNREKLAKPSTPLHEDGAGHTLDANRPNPFSGSTTISFTLPRAEHATLSVYDANGALVRTLKDEEMAEGSHSVMFDASGLPSGTYLYRLVAGGFNETKTMTLEK